MIIDVLSEHKKYELLNPAFKTVFEYLKNNDLSKMACGKYEIDGDKVFFNLNEYETKPEQKLEAHKKYIDIQVVIKGREYMGYCNIDTTSVKEEYNEEKDVMFLDGRVDKVYTDNKYFIIFYPNDAHKPALCVEAPEYVKKAIFKIAINITC